MAACRELLEIDSELMPLSSLKINDGSSSSSSKSSFKDHIPWKSVKPSPGICLKSKKQDGGKVFINLCHTKDMPAPRDISEAELVKILESTEPSSYKMAMSLADAHLEADKAGNPCEVYDVAINTDFFKKVESSELFKNFVISVVSEGLQDKYKFEFDPSAGIVELKNRKAMGVLQYHRIEQRPINYSDPDRPKMLIEELSTSKSPISSSSSKQNDKKSNVFIIRTPPTGTPEHLIVYIRVKNIMSPQLHLGEDRIIVRDPSSMDEEPFVDVFIPYFVKYEAVETSMDPLNEVLTLKLPVIP